MTAPKTAIWDFDGTLGHRRHGTWAECLLEVLDVQEPGHRWAFPEMFTALATGFPWNAHQEPHPQLSDPDVWWDHITRVVSKALTRLGISHPAAVAAATRDAYTDPAAWSLYPQTLRVLDRLTAHGWTHVLLSNHVPELPELLSALGIDTRFQAVINSAASGYEKPHPQAFQLARAAAGPARRLVMSGDNPQAVAAALHTAGAATDTRVTTRAAWLAANGPGPDDPTRTGLRMILGIALLCTATALANTLVMATSDRGRDLAVLRLAGATTAQVLRLVAAEAVVAVGVGAVLGGGVAAVNLLVVRGALALLGVTSGIVVPWGTLGLVVAAAALLAALSAVLPASLALRTRPVELAGARE